MGAAAVFRGPSLHSGALKHRDTAQRTCGPPLKTTPNMTNPVLPSDTISPYAADVAARQLRRMHQTLAHMRHRTRGRGPRGPRASMAAALAIATLFVQILLTSWLKLPLMVTLACTLGVPALVYAGAHRFSRLPASWEDRLDVQLANYVPLDAAAYRALQQETRDVNCLHPALVEQWLERESQALGQRLRELAPRKRYRFWEQLA